MSYRILPARVVRTENAVCFYWTQNHTAASLGTDGYIPEWSSESQAQACADDMSAVTGELWNVVHYNNTNNVVNI